MSETKPKEYSQHRVYKWEGPEAISARHTRLEKKAREAGGEGGWKRRNGFGGDNGYLGVLILTLAFTLGGGSE